MSLVEQTIARIKKQQQAKIAAATRPDEHESARSPHRGVASLPADDHLETTQSLVKAITVDNAALRSSGYFPEEDLDRQFADQYRRIKRSLVDKALTGAAGFGDPRIIMVASALPGDGKTFTSINLALSMSLERDLSVLLVDADVPKRHVSEIFKLQGQPGLLDALVDENLDAESVIVPTTTRGFSILPAGTRVSGGTTELLSSRRMRNIVASLCSRNHRRVLLLDSPPLLVTNEASALAKFAGQVVLVVRAERTPREAVQAAVALLDPRQAGGIVLNHVRGGANNGYYGYGTYGSDGD